MIVKIQYTNQEDRQLKLVENKDKYLIEEQNIAEGNYLVFSKAPPVEYQIQQLQQDNLILMDALAMTFEEILTLKAQLGGS